jgi:GT2 family glycosyltransferase
MWNNQKVRAPFAMRELEITEAIQPIHLAPNEGGVHLLLRYRGRPIERLWLTRSEDGPVIPAETLEALVMGAAGHVGTLDMRDGLFGTDQQAEPVPDVTIAVCTRNRPDLLRRCLGGLTALVAASPDAQHRVEVLVVDNAPPDEGTRHAAEAFSGVRYAVEMVPGLNFARNRALAESTKQWLAFIDDDAVVDRFWLERLAEGVSVSPSAGGFTGPILPLMLETEAQLRFEREGGFGKGFDWHRFSPSRPGDPVYPHNAGRFGTGACMVFNTTILRSLGGFDEALDTGPPLPGGGDIDMFYRVVCSGRPLIYLPGLLVHHEHRRDMVGLRKQYYSWGTSVAAFLQKNRKGLAGSSAARGHRAFIRWWLRRHALRLSKSLLGRGFALPQLVLAEIGGGVIGYAGEYERSQKRIAARKKKGVAA